MMLLPTGERGPNHKEEEKLSVPVYTVLLNLVKKGWRWRE